MLTPVIFKANDIRGVVDGPLPEWDLEGARSIGAAFAELSGLNGLPFVLGRDMRVSGPAMSLAFAQGAMSRGAIVLDSGLSSTDQLWFASGSMNLPGVQFTASHNPADYNGIKFCRSGARPATADFLRDLAARAMEIDAQGGSSAAAAGEIVEIDTLYNYAEHLRSLVNWHGLRPLRVVIDAGNGMAGLTARPVLEPLDLQVTGLFLDLDGTFPNHQPNPLEPKNLVDAQRAVIDNGADVGLVFDGDADRCFIIDELGRVVTPSAITALIAASELQREPGATIVVNSVTSPAVAEVVAEQGGRTVVSRVGHTYVKALMAEHNAIFGGEHSAHYYFRDFWSADTGMLAALHVLCLLGHGDQPLSAQVASYERYASSGELNSTVTDVTASMERVAQAFSGHGELDWTDGLMVRGHAGERGPWQFSLRPSNTEPLLRLNVEARDAAVMAGVRDDVLDLVRQGEPVTDPEPDSAEPASAEPDPSGEHL